MTLEELKTKTVSILGFGAKEGIATARFLQKHGIVPVVHDKRTFEEFPEDSKTFLAEAGLQTILGDSYLNDLESYDVIFRNPAVPYLTLELQRAKARGTFVTSQTKWFFEHSPARIIGVTGTKGKGTTSSLIYKILKKSLGEKVHLTGNIGYGHPFELLDTITEKDWVVFELSSFQLQDLETSPHIAVALMITSEHLDHHIDTAEYREAKQSIVAYQKVHDTAIINMDYEGSRPFKNVGKGQKLEVSKGPIEKGCRITDEGVSFINMGTQLKINKKNLSLRGDHNLENIAAASLASFTAGATPNDIIETCEEYTGLEHRLEYVGEISKVHFYNDSIATVPEATIAAVRAFTEPLILIAGGSEKDSNFDELGNVIREQKNIKGVILTGPSGERIKNAITASGGAHMRIYDGVESMADIFTHVSEMALPGDVVLLSPGAASFDLFKNYAERGEQFKKMAKKFTVIHD